MSSGDTYTSPAEEYWLKDISDSVLQPLGELSIGTFFDDVLPNANVSNVRIICDGLPRAAASVLDDSTSSVAEGAKRHFETGCSVNVKRVQELWAPLGKAAATLGRAIGSPVTISAYAAPPEARGINPHYDFFDVFVVQGDGEKQWSIYRPPTIYPIVDMQVDLPPQSALLTRFTLRQNQCLYVPRGLVHAVSTGSSPSLHFSVYREDGVTDTQDILTTKLSDELRKQLPDGPEDYNWLLKVHEAVERNPASLGFVRNYLREHAHPPTGPAIKNLLEST